MQTLTCIRRPNPLWASVVLLVAASGVALAAVGADRHEARRVRAGGTRGVGVIHQVRVEPYGRAAAEHAYFDDDELETLADGDRASAPRHESPGLLPAAAALSQPTASQPVLLLPVLALFSADRLGLPAGRAPPLA